MSTAVLGRTWVCWATIGWHRDADTFVADPLDLGWGIKLHPESREEPGHCAIRVLFPGGVPWDAWETKGVNKAKGLAAAARARELLPVGAQVRVESHAIERYDNFGRTLGSVTLPGGWDLATLLDSEGHTKIPTL